jgi:hypothetical protein
MDGEAFQKKFGAPEKTEKYRETTGLAYISDGVSVSVGSNGKIIDINVYLVDENDKQSIKFKAANAATDKGIKKGSTYRELTRVYGEPVLKEDIDASDRHGAWLLVTYKAASGRVTFIFEDGILSRVSISTAPVN